MALGIRKADARQQFLHFLLGFLARHGEMRPHRFGDLCTNAMHRIEAGLRVLEDHRQHAAADTAKPLVCQPQQIVALQPGTPLGDVCRGRQQAEQCQAVSDLPDPLSPTMAKVPPAPH